MCDTLVLVDGSSYLHRAFHALPPLSTSLGQPSGAIYGVISMLKKLQKQVPENSLIVVVFDTGKSTFRHQLYPSYKAHRVKMPQELQDQIKPLHAIIKAMGFPLVVMKGVEADDIIGTLAVQAQKEGRSVLISTNDKDFAQLVNDDIHLITIKPNMRLERLDREKIIERFNVKPEQMVDYLALVGDQADNIPGVPLVGPKTAAKWLKQYESLENLIQCKEAILGKVGENLRTYQEHVLLAKKLIAIQQDIPLNDSFKDLKQNPCELETLKALFKALEFEQWLQALESAPNTNHAYFREYELILTKEAFLSLLTTLWETEQVVLDLETTSLNVLEAQLVGIAFAIYPHQQFYIPLQHHYPDAPEQLELQWALSQLKPWLEDPKAKKIGHHLKYDLAVLLNYDIALAGLYADTLLEAYLIDSTYKKKGLDALALEYLNYTMISFEEIAGKGKQQLCFDEIPLEKAAPYAAEDAAACLALHCLLEPQLIELGHRNLRDHIEMPLIPILAHIERQGVLIDADLLNEQSYRLQLRLQQLEENSYQVAGQVFNLSSPKQLQEILYTVHQLPILGKTKGGEASTSEKTLQNLIPYHDLPKLILEYRTLSKLKSTYTDTLPQQIHPKTGRVHTAYHQAVVITGRLSSSDPNLQNIPIRTEEGKRIRQAFKAKLGYKIISADYAQIELKIMAHFSQDKNLLEAFHQGLDVHAATAAEILGIDVTEVKPEQRRAAKTINFGLIYGISAFGLAAQLKTTVEVAQEMIARYFKRYPGVKDYMDHIKYLAHQQGYVQTLLGRRLNLPLINSKNKLYQKAAERIAINAPLQGTAADIIKKAMIIIDKDLKSRHLDAYMIMQVHDELVFEVKEEVIDEAMQCIQNGMQYAQILAVPLEVSVGIGNHWDEAH